MNGKGTGADILGWVAGGQAPEGEWQQQ